MKPAKLHVVKDDEPYDPDEELTVRVSLNCWRLSAQRKKRGDTSWKLAERSPESVGSLLSAKNICGKSLAHDQSE